MKSPLRLAGCLLAAALAGWALGACAEEAGGAGSTAPPVPEAVEPAYERRPEGELTYHRDIEPIVQRRCTPCHRPGEAAPFPLTSFAEVKRRARFCAAVVEERLMPPWSPQPGCAEFADSRRLSAAERGAFLQWVEEGAPAGDPAHAPPAPRFAEGWKLGEPDLLVEMPEAFPIPAEGADVFHQFVLPIPVERLRYVKGFEFRSDNRPLVHHARMLIDRSGRSRELDELDPGPGFEGAVLGSATDPDGHWMGWTPGKQPVLDPPGRGWRLHPGSDLVMELHLVPSGKEETIRCSMGLYFTDEEPTQIPVTLRIGPQFLDIPAHAAAHEVRDEYALPVAVDALAVYAHAHLLARTFEAWATLPDGSQEWLLRIADWSFDWQDEYRFAEPVRLPAGTVLHMRCTFDNTADNARNPNVPPERVLYGMSTANEMADLWLQVAAVDPAEREALTRDFTIQETLDLLGGESRVVEHDPDDARAHLSLGSLHKQFGNLAQAAHHFREATRIRPHDFLAWSNLGVMLTETGELPAAREALESALRVQPLHADSHHRLGFVFGLLKESDRAVHHYRVALRTQPEDVQLLGNLGNELLGRGESAEAVVLLQRAVDVAPEVWFTHTNLANALRVSGQFEPAVMHYRNGVARNPGNPATHYFLAWTLERLGRLGEAIAEYEEVARLDPANQEVRQRIRALGGG